MPEPPGSLARGRSAAGILVVAPDTSRRQHLSRLVETDGAFELVMAGARLEEAAQRAQSSKRVDVVLVDLDAAESRTMRHWALLRLLVPRARVVGLTSGRDDGALELALAGQVTAVVRADAGWERIRRALRNASIGIEDWEPPFLDRAKEVVMRPSVGDRLSECDLFCNLQSLGVGLPTGGVCLSDLEIGVLLHLARNAGRPVDADELLRVVWRCAATSGGTHDQVWSCIRRLRRKLGDDPRRPRFIRTLRKRGYVLLSGR